MSNNTHSADLEAGSSNSFSITDASQTGLDLTGDFTIEFWFNPESLPTSGNLYYLVTKWLAAGNQKSYYIIFNNPSGTMRLQLNLSTNGSAGVGKSVVITPTVGKFDHYAITFDSSAGTAEFFFNGGSIGTGSGYSTGVFDSTAPFEIGCLAGATCADGLINEVRVWNDIRTQAEINDNHRKQLVGDEAGLQGYWRFNNDATDETSNNNDLTNNFSTPFVTITPWINEEAIGHGLAF